MGIYLSAKSPGSLGALASHGSLDPWVLGFLGSWALGLLLDFSLQLLYLDRVFSPCPQPPTHLQGFVESLNIPADNHTQRFLFQHDAPVASLLGAVQ